jgi:hypothetical protein
MNAKRKNTFLGLLAKLAEISPGIVLIGSVIGVIMAFVMPLFQSDLRGESNCGSWKAPVLVEKELAGTVKENVELLRSMHTISVHNYGKSTINGLKLTFRDAAYIEVQKNDDEPIEYPDRKIVSLSRLRRNNKDTIKIKVWTNYPVSSRSEFAIKQDNIGGEIVDIQCVTPVRGIAALVNKHPYISRGLIFVFVYLFLGFLYLWLRTKLSKRGQTSPNGKNATE